MDQCEAQCAINVWSSILQQERQTFKCRHTQLCVPNEKQYISAVPHVLIVCLKQCPPRREAKSCAVVLISLANSVSQHCLGASHRPRHFIGTFLHGRFGCKLGVPCFRCTARRYLRYDHWQASHLALEASGFPEGVIWPLSQLQVQCGGRQAEKPSVTASQRLPHASHRTF